MKQHMGHNFKPKVQPATAHSKLTAQILISVVGRRPRNWRQDVYTCTVAVTTFEAHSMLVTLVWGVAAECCPSSLAAVQLSSAGMLIPIPIPILQGLTPSPALACEPPRLMGVLKFGTLPLRVSFRDRDHPHNHRHFRYPFSPGVIHRRTDVTTHRLPCGMLISPIEKTSFL